MSRSDLLDAFLEGRIGRREFIQGLVAGGVALGAAAAHAAALKPAVAQSGSNVYGGGSARDLAQARAACRREAAADMRQQLAFCRANFSGRERTRCIRDAKDQYEVAQEACDNL